MSQPVERVWPGDGTRFRLVGDAAGVALYLRKEKVDELGWRDRLPPFCGWTKHAGFGLVAADGWPETPEPASWREAQGPETIIYYTPNSPRRVRVELGGTLVGEEAIEVVLRWNGREAARIELRAGDRCWSREIVVDARAGVNELGVLLPEKEAARVLFTKLLMVTAEEDSAGPGPTTLPPP